MTSALKRAQILGEALSARFSSDPRLLADASGVYVRNVELHSSAVLFAPGGERQPAVVAISHEALEPARSFLLAWALGLWALGFQDQSVYWRASDGPALEADLIDCTATAFADAFLDRGASSRTAGSGSARG